MTDEFEELMGHVNKLREKYLLTILGVLIVVVVVLVIWFYYKLSILERTTCKTFNDLYPKMNGQIRSIIPKKKEFQYYFRDYYIKTAYNACNTDKYSHSVVSTCALRTVLKQGARGLDFEVYSINDRPCVASSTSDKYTVKETYNKVDFSDILSIISNYAFTPGGCPNHKDPIILHLRFRSRNQNMYRNFAKILDKHKKLLLPSKYENEAGGTNIGAVPLMRLW